MKTLKLLVLLALITPVFFACEKEEVEENIPVIQNAAAFDAVYRIPLVEANVTSGEADIIDNEGMETENKAALYPAVVQIVEDLKAGKLNAYPCWDESSEMSPDQYFNHTYGVLAGFDKTMSLANLYHSVEVIFTGHAMGSEVQMKPEYLRIVYIDLNQAYPDRNMVMVKIEDLAEYVVEAPQGSIPLPAYLNGQSYENYMIYVRTEDDGTGVRTHDDAVTMAAMLESGSLNEVIQFYRN